MIRMTLEEMIAAKEARKTELAAKAKTSTDVNEVRSINDQIDALNTDILNLRSAIQVPAVPAVPVVVDPAAPVAEPRSITPVGQLQPLGTYQINGGLASEGEQRAKELKEKIEKRGTDLLAMRSVKVPVSELGIVSEKRSVTVGAGTVVVPSYTDPTLSPAFNEVSNLVDRVQVKMLQGGESYTKGYISGYGSAGYSTEAEEYNTAEPTFGYAQINKTKITAYAEDTEEILKLPSVNYDAEVMNGISVSMRKFMGREILVGTGATNHFVGIFSSLATAIDAATDLEIETIDEDTLDDIIFNFGGDENVEDIAVLILNKSDLKAFSKLRDANGKKLHTIVVSGNTGTIDTIPFIINSACHTVETATTGQYCMAYGPMNNYLLSIFSDMDVQRSTDYKFKTGQIAHRGDIFAGGNVVAKNGFLRVKKGA